MCVWEEHNVQNERAEYWTIKAVKKQLSLGYWDFVSHWSWIGGVLVLFCSAIDRPCPSSCEHSVLCVVWFVQWPPAPRYRFVVCVLFVGCAIVRRRMSYVACMYMPARFLELHARSGRTLLALKSLPGRLKAISFVDYSEVYNSDRAHTFTHTYIGWSTKGSEASWNRRSWPDLYQAGLIFVVVWFSSVCACLVVCMRRRVCVHFCYRGTLLFITLLVVCFPINRRHDAIESWVLRIFDCRRLDWSVSSLTFQCSRVLARTRKHPRFVCCALCCGFVCVVPSYAYHLPSPRLDSPFVSFVNS